MVSFDNIVKNIDKIKTYYKFIIYKLLYYSMYKNFIYQSFDSLDDNILNIQIRFFC